MVRSSFICCCRHNFGDSSGKEEGKAKTWVVEPNTGKSCTSQTFHLSSRAQVGLAKKCHGVRPESDVEEHVIYSMHQCTPEALIFQPCRVGVGVFHVPPRRREACHFVGSELSRSQGCVRSKDSFDVSEAE